MYAVRVDGKKNTKKAKSVKSNVVARTITFDDYTQYLNEEIQMTRRQSCIRSKLHEVYTISKIAPTRRWHELRNTNWNVTYIIRKAGSRV
ncbi:hypothetical protein ALC57_00299 [Trachymyrmex cornetzi]|uniref:Uncharacterized protein n=1 Tax=Trachymyrmex cornetzi TaxID=471704 RepID=A0A151JSV7_9HYME|nr:hypothetical protein ALC57_00299 [Trachymyrmex cornetzi]